MFTCFFKIHGRKNTTSGDFCLKESWPLRGLSKSFQTLQPEPHCHCKAAETAAPSCATQCPGDFSLMVFTLLYTVLSKLCCWKLLVEVMKGWKLAKEFLLVSSARMSPAPWFLPSDYLAGKKSEETRVKITSKLACSVYKCWSQYLDAFKTCH